MRWWRMFLLTTVLLLVALSLPYIFQPHSAPTPSETPPSSPSPSPESIRIAAHFDGDTAFTALVEGELREVTMENFLPLVVAAEMPAVFEPEALKAQAVAARTYILYKLEHGSSAHPEADVCSDPACCNAYATENDLRVQWGRDYSEYIGKIVSAVRETDGVYLTYGGELIQSVFHASSSGFTEGSENIWNGTPYLVSVSTPETSEIVTDLVTIVRMSPQEFAEKLSMHGIAPQGEADNWLGECVRNSAGRVQSVMIGGTEIPGTRLRSIFSLRSTDFELIFDGTEFSFTVQGYGHGVGMSQQGANLMAKAGESFEDILLHYYPGTQLAFSEKSIRTDTDDD